VRHAAEAGVAVAGITDIQDCIVEDGQEQGIFVQPSGKATISGTTVRHNGLHGVLVLGDAKLIDSSVTANGDSGVVARTYSQDGKAICTIGEKVKCSGNDTRNAGIGDYRTMAGGQLQGAPQERILVT